MWATTAYPDVRANTALALRVQHQALGYVLNTATQRVDRC